MVVCGLRPGRDEADDLVEVDRRHPALEQALADVLEVWCRRFFEEALDPKAGDAKERLRLQAHQ